MKDLKQLVETIQFLVQRIVLTQFWVLGLTGSSTRTISLNGFAVSRPAVTHTHRSQDYKLMSRDGAVLLTQQACAKIQENPFKVNLINV